MQPPQGESTGGQDTDFRFTRRVLLVAQATALSRRGHRFESGTRYFRDYPFLLGVGRFMIQYTVYRTINLVNGKFYKQEDQLTRPRSSVEESGDFLNRRSRV